VLTVFVTVVCVLYIYVVVTKIETNNPCSSAELCLDSNAVCSEGTCQCLPQYYSNGTGRCGKLESCSYISNKSGIRLGLEGSNLGYFEVLRLLCKLDLL
jgi:EB module